MPETHRFDDEAVEQVAKAYGLSRRQFVTRFGGGVAGIVLAACSPAGEGVTTTTGAGGTTTTTGGASPTTAPGDTAAPGGAAGGIARIDATQDPLALDPIRFNADATRRIYALTNEALLQWEEDRSLSPVLADGMPEVSEDRLTYTIRIREGVTFHNGKELTAEDVAFTYNTVMNPDVQSTWASAFGFVESVEATDDRTVVVTLTSPFTPMMGKFAQIPIVPSDVEYNEDTYSRNLIGTGPFRFVEWEQGVKITLERNQDYWGETPPLDGVEFHTVPEDATRVVNLVVGEAHVVPDAPPAQRDNIENRGANFFVAPNYTNRVYVYPNLQEGRPTADVNFRKALAWAVDRQAIVDRVYSGAAVPASTYLSSGSLYFNEELGTHFGSSPDLEQAQQFLDQAGGPPAEPLTMNVLRRPDLVDVATIVQANWSELGIGVEIVVDEIGPWFQKLLGGQYDLAMLSAAAQASAGFGPDYPYLGAHTGFFSNFNNFSDPRMDELLEAAVAASPEAAPEAWAAVQEYDLEVLPQIQFVTARYTEGWQGLENYKPNSLGNQRGLARASLAQG